MNEALCHTIREVFSGVALGNGIGLQQAQGIDDYEPPGTCAHLRAKDEKEDWSRIPVEELNRCYSSLSFFDAEGMRFHLPAFLIAELRGLYRFEIVFSLTHLSEYNAGQFALLTPQQRLAVRAFLLHILDHPDHTFDRPDILRALKDYWIPAPLPLDR
jgi:hypothetical protein